MKVLVIGGAGYIGSVTVRLLLERGHEPVVLDNLGRGHAASVPAGVPLETIDTNDAPALRRVIEQHRPEAAVYYAGLARVGESMEDPGKYFANNVSGIINVCDILVASGISKLVFSSSAAVYGIPDEVPIDENARTKPVNPYGESKALCERMLAWFDACHGLRSVSLRYFNATGAAMDGTIGEDWSITLNLVPIVMKAVLERGPRLKVFGTDYPTPDGTAIRDYIHVDDLADAHLRALDYLRAGGSTTIVNLGTGTGSSVRQVIDMTERVSGHTVPRDEVPRRPGDPSAVWADNRKARELLGWEPVYGLAEIIESAYRWHAGHPDGFSE